MRVSADCCLLCRPGVSLLFPLISGQCVLALPSSSPLNPTFDLSLCRNKLEDCGFQVAQAQAHVTRRQLLRPPKSMSTLVPLCLVRCRSATWRSHWRLPWMFPLSGGSWFSTRPCSISSWHRYYYDHPTAQEGLRGYIITVRTS